MKPLAPKTGRPQGTTRKEILKLAISKPTFTYKDFNGSYNTFFQCVRKMVKKGELIIFRKGQHGGHNEFPSEYCLNRLQYFANYKFEQK